MRPATVSDALLSACSDDNELELECERSTDALFAALATGRPGVDELLESMFTDRTDDASARHEMECDSSSSRSVTQQRDHTPDEYTREHDNVLDASGCSADALDSCTADNELPETHISSDHTQQVAVAPASVTPTHAARQIVTFDVGGTRFRINARLIRKHPHKRLYHVITCGCTRISPSTYFIDRNPQHFGVILDWYRTGATVCADDNDALRADATYFDLDRELFSEPAPVPPWRHVQHHHDSTSVLPMMTAGESALATRSQSNSALPFSTTQRSASTETMRFRTTELYRVLADGAPVVFTVHTHEHVRVASVTGNGQLLVRVCDASGLSRVVVPRAVLFDSQACFNRQGARTTLSHCVLPGGYTYTFWMERVAAGAAVTLSAALEVAFELIATFDRTEQLTDALDTELLTRIQRSSTTLDPRVNESSASYELPYALYMFRPHEPFTQNLCANQARVDAAVPPHHSTSDRDAVAQQLFAGCAPLNERNRCSNNDNHSKSLHCSMSNPQPTGGSDSTTLAAQQRNAAIKRGGAAVIAHSATLRMNGKSPSKIKSYGGTGARDQRAGTITVYRHVQLTIDNSPRCDAISNSHSLSQVAKTHNSVVAIPSTAVEAVSTSYQDHQPRVFR